MSSPPLKGKLLVATPVLSDANFDHTVVLVLEHGDDGAVGVVLNRPSDTGLSQPLPQWAEVAADPPVVFVGGPVGVQSAIGLARMEVPVGTDAWSPVVGRVGTVDLNLAPDEIGPYLEEVRVFLGYAGWAPGQLEGEIELGAWVVVEALPEDVLAPEPETLWRRVLRRQRGEVAWLSTYLGHPRLN